MGFLRPFACCALLWALLCGFVTRLLLSFRPQLSSARGSSLS